MNDISWGDVRSRIFDTWNDDLQLYLLSDSRDSVSLFDHMSGAAPAPPATADSATHSQWLTRDAAARLAIRNHLPLAECAHFRQHRTAQTLYNAVVARYSSPATAALGRLLLPYLFPELSAFATVEDLLHLLAVKTSVVAVGAARGTPRMPFFEGCSPSPLAPSYASAAAVDVLVAEDVGAASASAKRHSSKGKGGRTVGGGNGSGGGASSGGSGGSGGGGSGGSGGGSGGVGGAVEAAVGVAVVAAVGVVAVNPHGSILCMGPPLASATAAAVLLIARLGHALSFCQLRAHGARPISFPQRARDARRRREGRLKGAPRWPLPSSSQPCPALPPCPGPALPGSALLPPLLRPYPMLGFGGGECVASPAPPPNSSPTAAAAAEGGGCVLGGGSRLVVSNASSPEVRFRPAAAIVTMVDPIANAGVADTLEARLADARKRHADGEYGTISLLIVELGIRSQWATEHPSRLVSPRPVRNEGVVDDEVDGGAQVNGNNGMKQRGVIKVDDGVDRSQARVQRSTATAGSSRADNDG
ncbi:unnamed protein product [Closterium sp. NIES-54]